MVHQNSDLQVREKTYVSNRNRVIMLSFVIVAYYKLTVTVNTLNSTAPKQETDIRVSIMWLIIIKIY